MDDTTFPLMTRRQFVEFVQRQTGIPLTYSRLMKDGATGRAPRPTAIFGKRHLYSEAEALSYAKALMALTESTAVVESQTGMATIYRRHNKPVFGPLGDSLEDLS